MSSVLMSSTMKSDPAGLLACGSAGGTPVSAAATAAEGGSAEGRGGAPVADVADVAALAAAGATAPATATPARNLRRSTFESSRDIVTPFGLIGRRSSAASGQNVAPPIAPIAAGRSQQFWQTGCAGPARRLRAAPTLLPSVPRRLCFRKRGARRLGAERVQR